VRQGEAMSWGVFCLGWAMSLLGYWEQALDAGVDPFWGTTWSFPCPHHAIIGFIVSGLCALVLAFKYQGCKEK